MRAGQALADQDADQAAHQAEHDRLDQELEQDRRRPRADRLAQADLARALGDRDEHDVHDPDAADEQRDPDDAAGHHRHRGGDRVELADELLDRLDAEVVGVADGDVAALAAGRR